MSIVQPWLPDAVVVDLCAGSGALGIEALSRGARHATFVESDDRVLRTLRENLAVVGAEDRSTVVKSDAVKFAAHAPEQAFDVAFADPPYAGEIAAEIVERWFEVPFARILGVEHAARTPIPAGGRTRRYGDSAITFYRVSDHVE
jgi:16S rRNA (guanine966-N2)-methyltransferase